MRNRPLSAQAKLSFAVPQAMRRNVAAMAKTRGISDSELCRRVIARAIVDERDPRSKEIEAYAELWPL